MQLVGWLTIVAVVLLVMPGAASAQANESESLIIRLRALDGTGLPSSILSVDLLRWTGIAAVSESEATPATVQEWENGTALLEKAAAAWVQAPADVVGFQARGADTLEVAQTQAPWTGESELQLWFDARTGIVDDVIGDAVNFANRAPSTADAIAALEVAATLSPFASAQVQVYNVDSLISTLSAARDADLRHAAHLENEANSRLNLGLPLATPWDRAATATAIAQLEEASTIYTRHGEATENERVDAEISNLSALAAKQQGQAATSIVLSAASLALVAWVFLRRVSKFEAEARYAQRASFLLGAHL